MKRKNEISAKQELLISHLLSERTVDAACGRAKVAVTTYWRWMKEPRFHQAYQMARRRILENTVARLQGLTISAIDTLEKNLNCENPSVETRTATVILEQAMKGLELLDLDIRLGNLEAIIEASEGKI